MRFGLLIAGVFSLAMSSAFGQTNFSYLRLVPRPMSLISPSAPEQCQALAKEWGEYHSKISELHQVCLDSNKGAKPMPGGECSAAACESLHSQMNSNDGAGDVEACRASVASYQRRDAERRARQEARNAREQSDLVPQSSQSTSVGDAARGIVRTGAQVKKAYDWVAKPGDTALKEAGKVGMAGVMDQALGVADSHAKNPFLKDVDKVSDAAALAAVPNPFIRKAGNTSRREAEKVHAQTLDRLDKASACEATAQDDSCWRRLQDKNPFDAQTR